MTVGFDKALYILPFDHRGSFQAKMFGWKGTLTPAQTAEIAGVGALFALLLSDVVHLSPLDRTCHPGQPRT